jgi:hypothetical protein
MQKEKLTAMANVLLSDHGRTEKDEELANEIMRNRMKYIRSQRTRLLN